MDEATYEVGYGKPPVKNQFPKGVSGNPGGRPRKAKEAAANESLADMLERIGQTEVEVQGKKVSLFELQLIALYHKAAKGDVAASRHLAKLREQAGINRSTAGGGVLVVPGTVPLHEWTLSAAIQQAKFRGEDPEGLAELRKRSGF